MRKLMLIVLLLPVVLCAQTVRFADTITAPQIGRNGEIGAEQDFITSDTGAPMLPFASYQFVLPYGATVQDVDIELTGYQSMSGRYDIPWNQQPVHTLMRNTPDTPRDEAIYGNDEAYPAQNGELVTVQRLAGVDIAVVNVYPYKYYPQSGALGYYSHVDVTIHTQFNTVVAEEQSRMICRAPHIERQIQRLTRNAEMMSSYPLQNTVSSSRDVDPNDPYDMVIVCGQDYVDIFTDYASWKEENGIHTGVFTIEQIYTDYTGNQPNKLREFIIDAYTSWASTAHPLQYVLLAGDDEIIPIRGLYASVNEVDPSIPGDIYYACLDGTWNGDNDQYYGETSDNPDLYAEVSVGRFPGDCVSDFENMISKTQSYLIYPTAALDNCTLVGELLDDTPTWGGDYKDDVVANDRLPSYYDVTTLYERDGTFDGGNPSDLIDLWDADDAGLINHMGHCDYNIAMGIVPSVADQLSNTEYPFLYSQGCYAMAWDQETSGDTECIGEHFLFGTGGLFAFVGNSRYGWYVHGSTNGASQKYDKQYFIGLFGQNIRNIGDCLVYSKESIVNLINTGGGTYRWLYFCINLFGDPQVPIINGEGLLPDLDILSTNVVEGTGDGDGILNPNEQGEITVSMMCLPGDGPAYNVEATLFTVNDYVTIINGEKAFGSLNPSDVYSNSEDPFVVQLSSDCPVGTVQVGLLIEANGGTNFYYAKRFYLDLNVELYLAGFPMQTGNSFKSSPVIVDWNRDNVKELFNVDTEGTLYGLDLSGNNLTGFPVSTGVNVRSSFCMGNIDTDQAYEFAMVGFNRALCIVDNDGTILYNSTDGYGIFMGTPTMADINGDGKCEIIVGDMNYKLFVLDAAGNAVGNFPITMPEKILSGVSVADIDNDNNKEIVVGCFDGKLYAIEADGTICTGYPVTLGGSIQMDTCVFGSGYIAVASSNNHLYVVHNAQIVTDITLPSRVSKTQIAADFDNDNEYELGFALESGAQYIVEIDGSILPGWPIILANATTGSPISCDLNADDENDYIIVDNIGTVHGFSVDGTYLPNFPIQNGQATDGSTLCVDDFSNDNTAELAIGTTGGLSVYDIKYTKGWLNVWRTYRGNIWRDGSTETITDVQTDVETPAVTALKGNYPNPFNPQTTVAFSLSAADASHIVSLKVYNVRGQLVKTLVNERLGEGDHQIVWQGTDDSERPVSSGVYFTRLVTASKTTTNKMLLLK